MGEKTSHERIGGKASMRDGEERGETRRTNGQGRNEKIKSEFMRGAKRRVPKKALIGAAVGLAVCVVVIVGAVVALGGFGQSSTPGDQDISALAAVEGDEVIIDDPIDAEEIAYLQISSYPELSFEQPGTVLSLDRELIERACDLLSGARFAQWGGYAQYEEETSQMVGGFSSGLAFLDADKKALLAISYDPGISTIGGGPGEGICIRIGDECCVMEGDQAAVVGFIDECVESALVEYESEGAYSEYDPTDPHTWVPKDEIETYESWKIQGGNNGCGNSSGSGNDSSNDSSGDNNDKGANHA